jgi:hypothetical protein
MSSCVSLDQVFQSKLELDPRKLLKWKQEIDSLNLKTQQLGDDLHALALELKMAKKVEQPVVPTEESNTHESNEVKFVLHPKFDEYEEDETTMEEVMEKMEEGETLVPRRTFGGLEDGKGITLAPAIPSKLPQKSTHPKSVQLSFFHRLNKPSLRVSKTFRE